MNLRITGTVFVQNVHHTLSVKKICSDKLYRFFKIKSLQQIIFQSYICYFALALKTKCAASNLPADQFEVLVKAVGLFAGTSEN